MRYREEERTATALIAVRPIRSGRVFLTASLSVLTVPVFIGRLVYISGASLVTGMSAIFFLTNLFLTYLFLLQKLCAIYQHG